MTSAALRFLLSAPLAALMVGAIYLAMWAPIAAAGAAPVGAPAPPAAAEAPAPEGGLRTLCVEGLPGPRCAAWTLAWAWL